MKQCRQLPLAPNGHGALFRSNGGNTTMISFGGEAVVNHQVLFLSLETTVITPRKSTYISIASIHSCAGCLCAYDARHSSLLRIRPSSGHVDAFHLPLEAEGYTRLVAWHENLVIFAEGGQEREVLGELGNFQKATNRHRAHGGLISLGWALSGSLTTHALGLYRGHVTEIPS